MFFDKSFCNDFNDEAMKPNLLFVVGWFGRIFCNVSSEVDTRYPPEAIWSDPLLFGCRSEYQFKTFKHMSGKHIFTESDDSLSHASSEENTHLTTGCPK